MTTQNELVSGVAMYGGSMTSCTTAAAWYWDESMIVMAISVLSVLVAICGLIFTVWDRNRQFKLALAEREFERQQWILERNDRRESLGLPLVDGGEVA